MTMFIIESYYWDISFLNNNVFQYCFDDSFLSFPAPAQALNNVYKSRYRNSMLLKSGEKVQRIATSVFVRPPWLDSSMHICGTHHIRLCSLKVEEPTTWTSMCWATTLSLLESSPSARARARRPQRASRSWMIRALADWRRRPYRPCNAWPELLTLGTYDSTRRGCHFGAT